MNIGTAVSNGNSLISNILYIVVSFIIVYVAYRLVYPTKDPREATVLEFSDGGVGGSKTTDTGGDKLPQLFTGGEVTLSYWMYVSDWEVRAGRMKHVVTVKGSGAAYNSIVCALYPLENKLMVRVRTAATNAPVGTTQQQRTAGSGVPIFGSGSEFTDGPTFTNLMVQNSGLSNFMNTVNHPICDLPEFDLQRWIHVCIVVNGRVCDVYLDGKLSRSCMLDNVIQFPKTIGSQSIQVDTTQHQGFGGALSKVQLMSYAVTPDRVYGIYQAGPTLKSNTLVDRFLALFGINLTFSAYKVTPPQQKCSDSATRELPTPVANFLDTTGLTSSGPLGNIITNPMGAFT
jgi:hypothetical protein